MNQKANAFEATLLVAGNIMGSGIFLVPTQLAGQGSVALLGWIVSLVGVAALALTFAQLSAFDESSSTMGGMYGFTRKPFGRRVGWFVTATYFMSVVFGNCAGAIVGVGYLSLLWPLDSRSLVIVTVVAIWAVTVLNLVGAHAVVRVQGVCTVLTCLPIFAVAVFGWISFDAAVFWESWNVSGESDFWAVQRGLNVQLWAFTGLETAAAVSLVVRNPRRDVPIATCCGVLIAGVGYVLSCTVMTGLFAAAELRALSAPFAAALARAGAATFGVGADVVVAAVGLCAAAGGAGSLAGWMLVAGHAASAAHLDGEFPAFLTGARGAILTSLFMTVVVVCASLFQHAETSPFVVVAGLSSLLTLPPYALVAAALAARPERGALWSAMSAISILFCLLALLGSRWEHIGIATVLSLGAILAYAMFSTKEEKE